ncbi:hypothetical protein KY284_033192 [Solanum tuberosum]|nr:hypothetical protein KY284_033192 [Solanum tuberosum]
MIFNPKIPNPVLWTDPLITHGGIVMMWMMTYLNARIPERSGGNLVCQVGLNRILMGLRKKAPGPGGLGGVIRNHRGDWISGFYQQRSPCQHNPGKVRALRQGVLMAIEYKLNPIDINTDSMELINMFEHDNHLFTNLIFECRLMPAHIFREQNKVSDKLSKEGL